MSIKVLLISFLLSAGFFQKKKFIHNEVYSEKNTFSVIVLTETQGFVHHEAIKEGVKLITRLGK